MAYKILIDKTGTPKLVEVPEKPRRSFGTYDFIYPSLKLEYEQAISTALADEKTHIAFKDEARVIDLLSRKELCSPLIVRTVGQTFDLPENIGVSFLDGTTPEGYYKLAILTPKPVKEPTCGDCGQHQCDNPNCVQNKSKPENSAHSFTEGMEVPESVPSCGEPEKDNFYKWILTEIVEFERLKGDMSLPSESRNAYDLAFIQMKKVRAMYNDRDLTPTKH